MAWIEYLYIPTNLSIEVLSPKVMVFEYGAFENSLPSSLYVSSPFPHRSPSLSPFTELPTPHSAPLSLWTHLLSFCPLLRGALSAGTVGLLPAGSSVALFLSLEDSPAMATLTPTFPFSPREALPGGCPGSASLASQAAGPPVQSGVLLACSGPRERPATGAGCWAEAPGATCLAEGQTSPSESMAHGFLEPVLGPLNPQQDLGASSRGLVCVSSPSLLVPGREVLSSSFPRWENWLREFNSVAQCHRTGSGTTGTWPREGRGHSRWEPQRGHHILLQILKVLAHSPALPALLAGRKSPSFPEPCRRQLVQTSPLGLPTCCKVLGGPPSATIRGDAVKRPCAVVL